MIRRVATLAIALAGLTACDAELTGTAQATDIDPAGVSFTGQGNEPGWTVTVADGQIALVTDYGEHQITRAATAASRTDASRSVTVTDNGAPLIIVTQTFEPCRDDMSGELFPYMVEVQYGERKLTGCGGKSAAELTRFVWSVMAIGDDAIHEPEGPSIRFMVDGEISGSTGCNSFGGSYELIDDRLHVGPLRMTRRACVGAGAELEAKMIAFLGAPISFDLEPGGNLVLSGEGGARLTLVAIMED